MSNRNRMRLAGLALAALLGGCNLYLHDPAIEKSTAKLAEDFKAADLAAKIKQYRDNLAARDAAVLVSVVGEERALRAETIAGILDFGPADRALAPSAWALLRERQGFRFRQLAGAEPSAGELAGWRDLGRAEVIPTTVKKEVSTAVPILLALHKAATGEDFADCAAFKPKKASDVSQAIKNQCDAVSNLGAAETEIRKPVDVLLKRLQQGKIDSALLKVEEELKTAQDAVATVKSEQAKAKGELERLEREIKELKKQPQPGADLAKKVGELNALIDKLDQGVKAIDQDQLALGKVLASVEFKKSNLRDVLVAIGKPVAAGDKADSQAQRLGRSITGLIAGLQRLEDTTADPPKQPSAASLAIALAAQQGLARTLQARLDGLQMQAKLLVEQKEGYLREYEMLARSRLALNNFRREADKADCKAISFAGLQRDCAGADVARQYAAEAITSFAASWAGGRTPAMAAYERQSSAIRQENLRVSEENTAARTAILKLILDEMAAYGAGGIDPQTLATLGHLVALAVIGKGVN